MRVIVCIINFMAFVATVMAAVASFLCARVGCLGLACGDFRLAAVGWLGMVWFLATGVMFAARSFKSSKV